MSSSRKVRASGQAAEKKEVSMPRYSPEFRERAVDRLKQSGKSVHAVSKELGVSHSSLKQWVEELEAEGFGVSENEQVELKRLRKEVHRLRMEQEILKKAVAFFAKEKP